MKDAKAIITRNMSKRMVLQQPITVPRELMKNLNYGYTLEYFYYLVQCAKVGSAWESKVGSFSEFLKGESKTKAEPVSDEFHLTPPLEEDIDMET